jgi:hypothetical protein
MFLPKPKRKAKSALFGLREGITSILNRASEKTNSQTKIYKIRLSVLAVRFHRPADLDDLHVAPLAKLSNRG